MPYAGDRLYAPARILVAVCAWFGHADAAEYSEATFAMPCATTSIL